MEAISPLIGEGVKQIEKSGREAQNVALGEKVSRLVSMKKDMTNQERKGQEGEKQ